MLFSSSVLNITILLIAVFRRVWLWVVVLSVILSLLAYPQFGLADTTATPLEQALGWVSDQQSEHRCQGYYMNSSIIAAEPLSTLQLGKHTDVRLKSDQLIVLNKKGCFILKGHVSIRKPLRLWNADQAVIFRDPSTGHILLIRLSGHIKAEQPGKLILADKAVIDFQKKSLSAHQVYYRLVKHSAKHQLNPWGWSKHIQANRKQGILLKQASYTTCPVNRNTWRLKASTMQLDPIRGWGQAINTTLLIKDIPVMYFPYLIFPLDNRRRTGFLLPDFSYTDAGGLAVNIPFYLNVAPNADLKLIPGYIDKRGMFWQLKARYLMTNSNGHIQLIVLPNDRVFEEFLKQADSLFTSSDPGVQLGLRELMHDKSLRYAVGLKHRLQLGDFFSSRLDINLASDAYLFYNFGNVLGLDDIVHLLNRFDATYSSEHWYFLGKFQAHQTLHAITSSTIRDIYSRLPQIVLETRYPYLSPHLDVGAGLEMVNFDHKREVLTNSPIVGGVRLKLNSSVAFPWYRSYGFLIPRIQLMLREYWLRDRPSETDAQIEQALPLLNVDMGLKLERLGSVFGSRLYRQVITPRLFYLYVPFKDQTAIPLFDTKSLPFSFAQLFRANRFVGYDRIGDANQVSAGLTARLIDPGSGIEVVRARLGVTYYLRKHRVCLDPNCQYDQTADRSFSPLITEVQYRVIPHWHVMTAFAWDVIRNNLNNGYLNLLYQPRMHYGLSLRYYYIRNGDIAEGEPMESDHHHLNRLTLGFNWLLARNWRILGSWGYNISHQHAQRYVYGVEYHSCCWAFRALASRTFQGLHSSGGRDYQYRYVVQFQLNGLGRLGNDSPGYILERMIPGYIDQMR